MPSEESGVRSGRQHRLKDIQGLRGIAVSLVVIYHAHLGIFPGGYIGVDVFFVISGFLITRHLLQEHRSSGRIKVASFYARRIRRLLPASSLVLIATLILARIMLPPLGWPDVASAGRATALYGVNIYFASNGTDYLANSSASPFQHYWSLSLEEQFYLAWPLFLIFLLSRRRRRKYQVFAVVAVLVSVSFVLSVVITHLAQPIAFFLLPTRAWELGVGALIALREEQASQLVRRVSRRLVRVSGLVLIVATALVISEGTTFPGWVAALPVLGAALVIMSAIAPRTESGSNRSLLHWGPLQQTGNLSYSIYLWHWPLFTLPQMYDDSPASLAERLVLLLGSVVLGYLTYHWVEIPSQRFRIQRPAGILATAALLTAMSVAACSLTAVMPRLDGGRTTQAWPRGESPEDSPTISSVPRNLRPSLIDAAQDMPDSYADGCHASQTQASPKVCWYGPDSSPRSVVLFGDSHAAQWLPAFESLSATLNFRLLSLTKSACPSLEAEAENRQLNREYWECDEWRSKALTIIRNESPDLVVISNYYQEILVSNGKSAAATWATALTGVIAALPKTSRVLVLGDTPDWKTAPAVCASGNLHDVASCTAPTRQVTNRMLTDVERETALTTGSSYINPVNWICPNQRCPVIAWNTLIYRDNHHLTATYSRELSGVLTSPIRKLLGG